MSKPGQTTTEMQRKTSSEESVTSGLDNAAIMDQLMSTADPTQPITREAANRTLKRVGKDTEKSLQAIKNIMKKASQRSQGLTTDSEKTKGRLVKKDETSEEDKEDFTGVEARKLPRSNATNTTLKSTRTNQTASRSGLNGPGTTGRSILKNGRKGNPNFHSVTSIRSFHDTGSEFNYEGGTETVNRKKVPRTNVVLPARSWSVSSFDSCGGDTKRCYRDYLMKNKNKMRQFMFSAGFNIFVPNEKKDYPIPRKLSSHYEDLEPYGPVEMSLKKSASKSSSTRFGMSVFRKGNTGRSKSDNRKSKGLFKGKMTLRGKKKNQASSKYLLNAEETFRSKRSAQKKTQKHYNMSTLVRPQAEPDPVPKEQAPLPAYGPISKEQQRRKKTSDVDDDTVIFMGEEDEEPAEMRSNKNQTRPTQVVTKSPPVKTIPQEMMWSDRQKRLVFRPMDPANIPEGKTWDKKARNGLGGLVNTPRRDLPPDKIWDTSAANGQGGVVNKRPRKIQRGMKWDPRAQDGMGALVHIQGYSKKKIQLLNKREKTMELEFDILNLQKPKKNPAPAGRKKQVVKTKRKTVGRTKKTIRKNKVKGIDASLYMLEPEPTKNEKTTPKKKPEVDDGEGSVKTVVTVLSVRTALHSVKGVFTRTLRRTKTKTAKIRNSIVSRVSRASTKIMEEAGLEDGHVMRLSIMFGERSQTDDQYDSYRALEEFNG
eukprot:maker-scaffold_7-snap-gene-16.6-mRNA-1 protein AED:0.00 eAED:0.00 QI:106/1/1/1/1/1/2/133/707